MKKLIYLFLFLYSANCYSQQFYVSGKITDINGEVLTGATILEKGTNNGITSDYNGNYELSVNSSDATLLVTFIGFEAQEVAINERHHIDITLQVSVNELGEVVISGFMGIVGKSRKRTESAQSIPESVTALNMKGIKSAGVTDIRSFSSLVPNFKFSNSQAVGVNFITIRGIPQIKNGDAPVAFVIDGVTIPDPSLLNQELFDLALVEVVKGPQGALYGKNAIGGAINIYTLDPTNQFTNKFKVGFGNGNSKLTQFVSSGALKKDKVFFRLSAQYKDFDGLLKNETLDTNVDFMKNLNFRGQIKAKLTDKLSLTATYQYFEQEGGATYYSVDPSNNFFDPGMPGGIQNPTPKEGNNIIVSNELGKSDMINHFGNIKFEYNSGKIKFLSLTSYNNVKRSTFGDYDFLEYDDFTQDDHSSTKTFNQEFRIQNNNNKSNLNWSAGGFYQHVEEPFFQQGLVRDDDTWEQFNVVAADLLNKTTTIAIFGFVDYKITDKLTASAGFRFDIDKFSQDDYLFSVNSSRKNNEFQPKVSLSYKASKGVLLYANYGRGYRTGGFNPAVTDLFNRDFKDELTDSYELGLKTSWWDNRFILNGAIFYTNFKNQQQYILELTDFYAGIYNYDKSKIVGFELDAKLRLFKFLDFIASYGYTNAEIVEGGTTGGDNGTTTNNGMYNGNKVPFVPVSNYSIGFASSFPLTKELNFSGFVNLNNTGKTYWHESNLTQHTSDAYSLLDAHIGLDYKGWGFELWGRNLLDTQYYEEFSPGEFFGSPNDVGWRGRPLSFGASVTVKF